MMDGIVYGKHLSALCTLKNALHQYNGAVKPKINTARSKSRISFTLLFFLNRKLVRLRENISVSFITTFGKIVTKIDIKNKLLDTHLNAIIFNL
jgi:hypothetical protein